MADWMFSHLGGLQILEPGYKKSRAPLTIQSGQDHASCSIRTAYGLLACEWKRDGDELSLDVTVPANTTAKIIIPAENANAVHEGNQPAQSTPGVKQAQFKDRPLILTASSGHYTFTTPIPSTLNP